MTNDSHNFHEALRPLLQQLEYAMMTTQTNEGVLTSRPVQTLQVDDEGAFWFFTSIISKKVAAIRENNRVNLAYANSTEKIFFSVSGRAEVLRDRHKAAEMWSAAQLVFFPQGQDDPQLALLKVIPEQIHYWNGNESIVGLAVKFGKAILGGRPSDVGMSIEMAPSQIARSSER